MQTPWVRQEVHRQREQRNCVHIPPWQAYIPRLQEGLDLLWQDGLRLG